jgi:hypothetical protein
MQLSRRVFHRRPRDDFSDGDHQEYVESGTREIVLIGAAALLLIGGFLLSLF